MIELNARKHKKVTINLVSKIAAKIVHPEMKLSSTRVERMLFRTEQEKVVWMVKEVLQNTNNSGFVEVEVYPTLESEGLTLEDIYNSDAEINPQSR